MDRGSYVKKVDFDAFKVDKFVPHLFSGIYRMSGCGASALSLMTGEVPLSMNREDWPSRFMAKHLRKRGFRVQKLTVCNLTSEAYVDHPITRSHVVLARIKLIKGEASWVVLHDGMSYHNFEITQMRVYEMIDHPVLEAFLVSHPRWFLLPEKKR